MKTLILATSALGLAAGCTASGTAERNAIYGAGAGAAAGAIAGEVIAGRPGRGAAYGAAIGAVGGAIVGCERSRECWGRARNSDRRYYDRRARRYYYVDPQYGDTWWENGEFRSYGRNRP
ncbi:MAG: hypothetical protein GC152_07795 [Alphaproteobacteria bacterium]|nr:hypothetical protein [Alphaproteobacteria bacterium]